MVSIASHLRELVKRLRESPPDLVDSSTVPILLPIHYRLLVLAFLFLVIYGSFVPFHFVYVGLGEAFSQYGEALGRPVQVRSRSDWAANVLLFIPLAFLLMGALAVDRPRKDTLIAAGLIIPACALFSAAIEFVQVYFPPRVPSINDVVAESLGGVIGTVAWVVGGRRLTLELRRLWRELRRQRSAEPLLLAYLVVLVLVHVMPMDLTISPVEFYNKYKEGRVGLIPFFGGNLDWVEKTQKFFTNVAYFLPVGFMLPRLSQPQWRQAKNWRLVLVAGFALAGVVEFMQLCVFTRYSDITDVLSAGLAVFAAWKLALRLEGIEGPAVRTRPGQPPQRRALEWPLLAGWVTLLLFINWLPFRFDFNLESADARLQELSFVPFTDYFQGNYLKSFDQVFSRILLFLPIGAILSALSLRHAWPVPTFWVVSSALVGTAILEMGQLFLPSRIPSFTDVLLQSFGVWLGFAVCRRAWAN